MARQATAFALGCALAWPALSQGLFDDNEARRRVELLRQQVEASQKALEDRLGKLESSPGERGALLDLAGQLEGLRSEIARMRGQIEVLANQIETADRRQKDLYVDIDTRLRKLEQAREQQAASADKPPAASSEVEGATPGEAKAYQAALEPVQARQLPHGGLGDAGLPGDVSRQLARAQCAVLDRHGLLRAARLQKRDRRAAQAPRGVARQPEGA